MKHSQGADELVAMLRRLLSSRGEKIVQQKRLRCAFHKLEAELQKGGSRKKASRKRVSELVAEIGKIACEELLQK